MTDLAPKVVWLGQERVHALGGEWSFLSIGSLKAAMMPPAVLMKNGYSHVINTGAFAYDKSPDIEYLDVPVVDSQEALLGKYFEDSNAFIDRAREADGRVLVHCRAGRSRSATLVCAYLISKGGMQVEEAMAVVRAARPIAQPNPGFIRQLQLWIQHNASSCPPPTAPSLGQVTYRTRDGRIYRGQVVKAENASFYSSNNVDIITGSERFSGIDAWLGRMKSNPIPALDDDEEEGAEGSPAWTGSNTVGDVGGGEDAGASIREIGFGLSQALDASLSAAADDEDDDDNALHSHGEFV